MKLAINSRDWENNPIVAGECDALIYQGDQVVSFKIGGVKSGVAKHQIYNNIYTGSVGFIVFVNQHNIKFKRYPVWCVDGLLRSETLKAIGFKPICYI